MADKSEEKQVQSSVERALCTYKQNISITIDNIAANLTEAFVKNYLTLEELAARIELRTRFLENTPEYFSQLKFNRNGTQYGSQLREFAQLRVILEENSKRLIEKLQEIHLQHEKLLNLIFKPASDSDSSQSDDGNVFEIISEKNVTVEPDVERRKPLFDLHSKLVKQVKATDSLEGFKTLMKRNPSSQSPLKKPPARNKHELERRYADSLYFFAPTTKGVKRKLSSKISVQSRNSCEQQKTKMSKSMPKNIISPQVKTSSTHRKHLATNQSRSSRLQLQIMGDKRHHLKCYDLLDDLDGNTLAPIKSEYPRRDNITSSGNISVGKEPQSYLKTILKTKDEKVWKKLLNPVEPPHPQKKLSRNSNSGAGSGSNNKIKSLMEYLTAPKHRITSAGPKTVTVLMVRVYYDNFPTKEESVTVGALAAVDKMAENEMKTPREGKSAPLRRKKVMLDHLRGLKARNDSIQKNIQKAIDVIETKMIDLLSSPQAADRNSTEAFTVMEKEIMNVLDMMSDDEESVADEKKKKRTEKIMEPEKDNNSGGGGGGSGEKKLQRGITMVKNTNMNDKQQQVRVVKQKVSEKKILVPKIIIQNAKLEEFKQRIFDDKKKKDEKMKKAVAEIEDSEKILGQVDSVIKNIDSIYTKINETESAAVIERKSSENSKKLKQQEIVKGKVKIMLDVNDGKKQNQTVEKVESKKISVTAIKSASATIKKKSEEVIEPPPAEKVIEETKKISEQEIKKISKEKLTSKASKIKATESEEVNEIIPEIKLPEEELKPVKIPPETVIPLENDVIKEEARVADEIFYKKYENVMKKFQEARIYSLNYNQLSISIHYPENKQEETIQQETEKEEEEEELEIIKNTNSNRNEHILNTFYSIFFSSIFIAFNTNFVC